MGPSCNNQCRPILSISRIKLSLDKSVSARLLCFADVYLLTNGHVWVAVYEKTLQTSNHLNNMNGVCNVMQCSQTFGDSHSSGYSLTGTPTHPGILRLVRVLLRVLHEWNSHSFGYSSTGTPTPPGIPRLGLLLLWVLLHWDSYSSGYSLTGTSYSSGYSSTGTPTLQLLEFLVTTLYGHVIQNNYGSLDGYISSLYNYTGDVWFLIRREWSTVLWLRLGTLTCTSVESLNIRRLLLCLFAFCCFVIIKYNWSWQQIHWGYNYIFVIFSSAQTSGLCSKCYKGKTSIN